MHALTKVSGILLLITAAVVLILGVVDMAPEMSAATRTLVRGGAGSAPLPEATSVKYRIGGELVFDIIGAAIFALFGWFLFTSEIQQAWAVVIVGLLALGSIIIRATPLLPLDVGKVCGGSVFWGAKVYADMYRAPLKPGTERRNVRTFPQSQNLRMGVTKPRLSGDEPHAAETVVLDFAKEPNLINQFYGHASGAKIVGSLAGTRTIFDGDFEKIVYSVPHLMVEKVEPLSAGGR